MLRFPDAKESVMKCCSSMVKGGINAYLYHTSDEFSKASSRTGRNMFVHTWHYSRHTLHVTETLISNGTRKFFMLFTNLRMRNKTLPIP
jgi:hypothetical protein